LKKENANIELLKIEIQTVCQFKISIPIPGLYSQFEIYLFAFISNNQTNWFGKAIIIFIFKHSQFGSDIFESMARSRRSVSCKGERIEQQNWALFCPLVPIGKQTFDEYELVPGNDSLSASMGGIAWGSLKRVSRDYTEFW